MTERYTADKSGAYVYVQSEPCLFTVGFFDPTGRFRPESDFNSRDDAAERVHWLNGGSK